MTVSHFRTGLLLAIASVAVQISLKAQCPTLNQTATLVSSQCAPGLMPCHLCPGQQMTLTATGTNLPGGGCVNWFYGTTNNFNPYNGEGTLLGCSDIPGAPPPQPCDVCPTTLLLFVDACGTEQDNEFMVSWSGSGFNVDQVDIDLPPGNNLNLPNDDDLGSTNCPFMVPTPTAINSVQTFCPGATVIGVGPGQSVPPGVPVVTFMSSNFNFGYNWGSLCPLSPVIYVMQNSCPRQVGAFSNKSTSTPTTPRTITFALDCGCSDQSTYTPSLLTAGANGDFFVDANLNFPPLQYGNSGCAFPPIPFTPPPPPTPVVPTPFVATITADMCNEGPFWVTGIVDPAPSGSCNDVFTNYLPFNVVCPDPDLQTATMCTSSGIFDLNLLEDPDWTTGTWSGPGVTGTNFNPAGQNGTVNLNFLPAGPCSQLFPTTIEVTNGPTAMFDTPPTVCNGDPIDIVINFTGNGPWTFDLKVGNTVIGTYTTSDNPFTETITVTGNTTVKIENFADVDCIGQPATLNIITATSPTATLTLIGSGSICAGQSTQLGINFSGGTAPYTFIISENGVPGNLQTTNLDPYIFTVTPDDDTDYEISFVEANGCEGTGSGLASVVVGDVGTGNLNDTPITICEGQSATLNFTFAGPPPFVFVYSINNVNQPPISTNLSPYQITVTPTPGTTNYELESMSADGCAGDVSGILQVETTDAPSAEITGDETICAPGGSAVIVFNLLGDPPFTINYTANNVAQTPITTNLSTYNLPVNPTVSTTYELTSVAAGVCPGTVSGTATVEIGNPLSAVISGGGQICQGMMTGTTITFTFVGDGPYNFIYSINNVAQFPIATSNNPYILNVNPPSGSIYRLVSVENLDCDGTVSGQANVFVFTPPTGNMLPVANPFCSPAMPNVLVDFTGTGPFTYTYSINGVPQPPKTTSEDPDTIYTNLTATTTFKLLTVSSPGCVGSPADSTTVIVLPTPTFSNVNVSCNLAAGNYILEFDVAGFTPPFTLLNGTGNFSASGHFTSTPILLANNYNIVFHDANDCGDLTVAGVPNCNCTTDAGKIEDSPISLCQDILATTTFDGGEILEPGDTLRFILHTDATNPPGQILDWNTVPEFSFLPGMTPGTTYFISAIAGDHILPDSINLADPCLDFSTAKPVVFEPFPLATFPADLTVCPGDSAFVDIVLTGAPPFTFAFQIGNGTPVSVNNFLGNIYSIHFLPTANTTVAVLNLEDKFCSDGTVTDQILVSANPQFSIQNLGVVCNLVDQTYVVEFDIAGGTPPFSVVGSGVLTGTHFISNSFSVGTTYNFTIFDGCGSLLISANPVCNCQTESGTVVLTPQNLCSTEAATAIFQNNQVLDGNDVLRFILQTNAGGNPIGNVLAWNSLPFFDFQPGVTIPGTTYFISAIAGNPDALGNVDLNDPCISVSQGVPVIWHEPVSAVLTIPTIDICAGELVDVPVSLTGTAPFTINYTINNVLQPDLTGILTSPAIIQLTSPQNVIVNLVNASNQFCPVGQVSGQTQILVHGPPQITGLETNCDLAAGTYTVSFSIASGIPPYFIGGNISLTLSGNVYTSDPLPIATSYNFSISDNGGCGAFSQTGNANCGCITEAGTMDQTPLDLCVSETATAIFNGGQILDANDTIYYILHTSPGVPVGNILATSTTPSFDFILGSMFPGLTYYISTIAGDIDTSKNGQVLITDPCLKVSAGTPVVWHDAPTAQIFSQNFDICPGESQALTIFFTGQAPFNFTYTLNNVPIPGVSNGNSFTINTTILQTSTFVLTGVSDANGCTGTANGGSQITVHSTPTIENVQVICAPDNLSYHVEFDVTSDYLASVVQSGSLGGNFDTLTGHFVSGAVPTANFYNAVISDLWGCGVDSISGVTNCVCTTFAGTMSLDTFLLCNEDPTQLLSAVGTFLDANDTLIYVLATTPGPPTWTILGTNSEPNFTFNAGLLTPNVTYYVLPVAGNNTPAGLDFGDPCLSISPGTPIVWRAPTVAFLTGNIEICQGDTASLEVQFSGSEAPFVFNYLENGVPQPEIYTLNNPYILKVSPTFSANYSLTSLVGDGCVGTVTGGAAVSVLLPPDLIDVTQTCDFVKMEYVVTFKIANGVAPNLAYTVAGLVGVLTDTTFVSDPIPFSQNFNLTVTNHIGCVQILSGANTCQCTSDAGTLNTTLVEACTDESVILTSNGDFGLDGNDAFQYILYENPTTLPAGVLATSNSPQFSMQPGMVAGQIYFVSAVAGNQLPNNSVDLNDPCLSVSPPVQVRFITGPAALITGNQQICPGENVLIPVSFTGTGPFQFVYALNGVNQLPIQSPQNQFVISSSNILDNQTFTLVSVSNGTCPGTVSGTAMVILKPVPLASLTGGETVCPGTKVNLIVNLTPGSSFDVTISDGTSTIPLSGIQNGFILEVAPLQTTTYTIISVVGLGSDCPAEIGPGATVTVAPLVPTVSVALQNGFAVSCFGFEDGKATATAVGGQPGYLFEWSGNQIQGNLENVSAGKYFVTITDAKGCTAVDSVEITEPPAINLVWSAIAPRCGGTGNNTTGALILSSVTGGAGPYSISLNGTAQQTTNAFPLVISNLQSGNYTIELEDSNGCLAEQEANVPPADELTVDLGDDITLAFGDSTVLDGQISTTVLDTFIWTPTQYLSHPERTKTVVFPFQSMRYTLTARDTNGCTATDDILIKVEKQHRVFIPNIIKTGAGTVNEFFMIFGGAELTRIRSMKIFDRWGENVFEGFDFKPGDIPKGWEGYWKEKWLLPGVYVYLVELEFVDGTTETVSGDVTIVR